MTRRHLATVDKLYGSEDLMEGVNAFTEKRHRSGAVADSRAPSVEPVGQAFGVPVDADRLARDPRARG